MLDHARRAAREESPPHRGSERVASAYRAKRHHPRRLTEPNQSLDAGVLAFGATRSRRGGRIPQGSRTSVPSVAYGHTRAREAIMRPTEPFRREHEELHEHIEHLARAAREVPRLSEEERNALRDRIVGFLRGTLMPHARAEEEVLYPEWAQLVGFADAAVPMVHDHEAIVARIERLDTVELGDVDTLQELLYGLYALISVHFRKEEDLQLPAFDAAPEVAERVLARMGEATGHGHAH